MRAVDARMIARLRSRGWVVQPVAGPDHGFREFSDLGALCHAPGCTLSMEDHDHSD